MRILTANTSKQIVTCAHEGPRTLSRDQDRDDETVDLQQRQTRAAQLGDSTYSNDTGHNNGDNTLHHEVRAEDRHGGNADS